MSAKLVNITKEIRKISKEEMQENGNTYYKFLAIGTYPRNGTRYTCGLWYQYCHTRREAKSFINDIPDTAWMEA